MIVTHADTSIKYCHIEAMIIKIDEGADKFH